MRASILSALLLIHSAAATYYVLQDDYEGNSFFDNFYFETGPDPTHGYVRYVDKGTAQAGGLTSVTSSGQVYIGVDHTNVPGGEGRASVRAVSNKSYNHALMILDLVHMPGGICGTWPAFWTVGPDWPNQGEIDILEGVHEQSANVMTLHTNGGCSMTMFDQQGIQNGNNCQGNLGCQSKDWRSQSYGRDFNANDGGVFAMEWTSDHIQVWFFPRGTEPNLASPDPSSWGQPMANFQGGCDIDSHFRNQQMIFDTTFCGDWAGAVWSQFPSCAAQAPSCESFVQNNPAAFRDAYWLINSLKVYQPGTRPAAPAPPPSSPTTFVSIPTSAPSQWRSLGCFADSVSARSLPFTASIASSMTVDSCTALCRSSGYSFAGVEYGQECYCGNSINTGSAQCNMPCAGNNAQNCGGSNALNVYQFVGSSLTVGNPSSYNGFSSYGCVNEPSTTVRALGNSFIASDMTIQKCLDHAAGFKYAGVEYGQECWYGDSLGAVTPSSACSSPCAADNSQQCGGSWALTLYSKA